MRKDSSSAGDVFRDELDELYSRYARLVAAIARQTVSGWSYAVPPPLDSMATYMETLQVTMPVPYPRPKPLPPSEIEETERRRRFAGVVSRKVHQRLYGSKVTTPAEEFRLRAAERAAWDWALALARLANPGWGLFRESSRRQVRAYLADVGDFCRRWRLLAAWATAAVIDYQFMRVLHGANQFLPVITSGSWVGDSVPLVVMLPGADPAAFAEDCIKFTQCRMVQDMPGPTRFSVHWEPDQDEQRQYERQENSTCVVLRWDGPIQGGRDSNSILSYFKDECATRIGRTVTKLEGRALLSQLDPQIHDAREHLAQEGWQISSDAPLHDHAAWLARRLLAHATWDEIATAFSPDAPRPALLTPVVSRACREFAKIAELELPLPAKRPRKGHLRA